MSSRKRRTRRRSPRARQQPAGAAGDAAPAALQGGGGALFTDQRQPDRPVNALTKCAGFDSLFSLAFERGWLKMARKTYFDPRRTVLFTLPICPRCHGRDLRTDRSERDEVGVIRWMRCRGCGLKFNAIGHYSAGDFQPAEVSESGRDKTAP